MSTARACLASLGVAVVLGVVGCEDAPTSSAPAVYATLVTMERTEYTPATGGTVIVRFENRSDRSVYFPLAHRVLIQKFENGAWQPGQPWYVVDGFGTYATLRAGGAVRDEWRASFDPRYAGQFRFRFLAYEDSRLRRPLPDSLVVSPSFTVIP